MKEYTVRYTIEDRWFESVVMTDSSESAMIWAEKGMRAKNVRVVKSKEILE
jgi:hypothetical protein